MAFDLFKPLELPPQLQWKYAHECALMEWTIKARNYNTFLANLVCLVFAMLMLLPSYAVSLGGGSWWSGALFHVLGVGFLALMLHQRMNTAYRLTQSGIECCQWKDFPKWMLTCLNWFAGVAAVICISLASTDPAFLLGAIVGPGSMGLMSFVMANSKSYQESQTQYHHNSISWGNISRLSIAPNREVVGLRYCFRRKDSELIRYWSLNIFCKRKEKNKVAELIRPLLLPDTPCVVAKVNIPPRGEL